MRNIIFRVLFGGNA